mmetsp:Transcript_23350/g.78503  ORF Transcript_23350/g.78503 Transcript_23350/m.78503 type:complete len:479 (-) Transcript_23350:1420-2856(-)
MAQGPMLWPTLSAGVLPAARTQTIREAEEPGRHRVATAGPQDSRLEFQLDVRLLGPLEGQVPGAVPGRGGQLHGHDLPRLIIIKRPSLTVHAHSARRAGGVQGEGAAADGAHGGRVAALAAVDATHGAAAVEEPHEADGGPLCAVAVLGDHGPHRAHGEHLELHGAQGARRRVLTAREHMHGARLVSVYGEAVVGPGGRLQARHVRRGRARADVRGLAHAYVAPQPAGPLGALDVEGGDDARVVVPVPNLEGRAAVVGDVVEHAVPRGPAGMLGAEHGAPGEHHLCEHRRVVAPRLVRHVHGAAAHGARGRVDLRARVLGLEHVPVAGAELPEEEGVEGHVLQVRGVRGHVLWVKVVRRADHGGLRVGKEILRGVAHAVDALHGALGAREVARGAALHGAYHLAHVGRRAHAVARAEGPEARLRVHLDAVHARALKESVEAVVEGVDGVQVEGPGAAEARGVPGDGRLYGEEVHGGLG